jgi:hypothetical protein
MQSRWLRSYRLNLLDTISWTVVAQQGHGESEGPLWEVATCQFTCLCSSLKGEVKKKHHSKGWSFSCFAAHLFEQGLF